MLVANHGASIVLDPPFQGCLRQRYPVSAEKLDALVSTAAQRLGLSLERARSQGEQVWLMSTGMTLNQSGQWIRLRIVAAGDNASEACYLGLKKQDDDPYENPVRVWAHFNAWMAALVFDVWVKQ